MFSVPSRYCSSLVGFRANRAAAAVLQCSYSTTNAVLYYDAVVV